MGYLSTPNYLQMCPPQNKCVQHRIPVENDCIIMKKFSEINICNMYPVYFRIKSKCFD